MKNADKFKNKGVHYCALCDGPLYKDKIIAIIGGSDTAAKEALLLSQYAKKVYIIYRKQRMRAEPALVEELENNKKVEFIYNANVTEVIGENMLEKVKLDIGKEVKLDGLFIEIGGTPAIALATDLNIETNEKGYIEVDNEMKTNVEGVYAAGDITTGSAGFQQLVTAASEGAFAAFSTYKFIKSKWMMIGKRI